MKKIFVFLQLILVFLNAFTQEKPAEQLLAEIIAKLDKVNDYEARGKMKMNVNFVKAPVASVIIYYKKPDKLRIKNESGISLIPKGAINISINKIVANGYDSDIIDLGKEEGTGLRILKLLPKDETMDIILSTIYIDEKLLVVKKARTTTRESGTYELKMEYGKYAAFGLADKLIFSFNTREYKLPKGVTFDYDDGTRNPSGTGNASENKGTVEITYTSYKINKGVPDAAFQ